MNFFSFHNTKAFTCFSFIAVAILFSCSNSKKISSSASNTNIDSLKFTAEAAPEWTNLFLRTSGWFGADGIFAIPHNGVDSYTTSDTAETTILFSDTMVGEIGTDNKPKPGYVMVHNTVAILKGNQPKKENIHFYVKEENGKPATFFVPNTPNTKRGDYYWLGDGFVNTELGNKTYIFCYRIRDTADGGFTFQQVGNALIILPANSKPPFTDQKQIDAPLYLVDTTSPYPNNYISYGSGVFVNTAEAGAPHADGYVYVYGVGGSFKNVMVARVKPKDFENFSQWRYWDGTAWNADIHKAAKIADRASNELSVTPLPDGRYAMVFQSDAIGNTVGLRLGLSPHGPFGPVIPLWQCNETKLGKNVIVYNAKVHSNLSKPGEMLISYNVGSFDFWNDIKEFGNFYRPRFIRVKLLE